MSARIEGLSDAEKQKMWSQNAARNRVVLMEGTKTCRLCHSEKHVTQFHINRQMIGGRTHECRVCIRAKQRAWRLIALQRPAYVAARLLSQQKIRAKLYGLTLDQLIELEARAEGMCDICQKPPRRRGSKADNRLHVDHCHETGKVRGMLCTDCNRAIGSFEDDPVALRRAAEYLETR